MDYRTDLALELQERMQSPADGVRCDVEERENIRITHIAVTTDKGAQALGKPIGEYITIEVPPFRRNAEITDSMVDIIAAELRSLLPAEGTVLVAGLGNEDITPDALGPKFSRLVLATRHIQPELAKSTGLGALRPVINLTPGVLGKTGLETVELLRGAVQTTSPCAVISVDALAAMRLSRLGCTIQIANTGVTPGSGVGNARKALNRESLGVPVIALGVPTVVDAATLVRDLTEADTGPLLREGADMMITPREIDLVIDRASRLLALAVNKALQPHLTMDEILLLVS